MRLAVINPNTTASMTEKCGRAARAVAASGTEILARNPSRGPAAIQGEADGRAAVPGLLAEVRRAEGERVDAAIIACFDDTGLDAARTLVRMPVVGIGEAAFLAATMVARRFSVITTLAVSVPIIRDNIERYALFGRCAAVRASDIPVLELERPGSRAAETISSEIAKALEEDGCDAIVLGCAGMAELAASLSERHGVPVIDGVGAAVKFAEGLVRLGLSTSKAGPYGAQR